MTAPGWREDTLHRTRIALGERLQRELQRQTQGRTAERGDLLLNDGDKGADRTMAQALQNYQAAQFAGLQAARAGEHRPDGPETLNALTMEMDHFVGADERFYLDITLILSSKIIIF